MSQLRRFCCLFALANGITAMWLTSAHAADVEQPLPLKRVVMFNSGVGFFEHSGSVEGNHHVEFPVNVTDINDLLKSLVVQDRGGGKVTVVSYGSPEPISRTLRSLAIDVSNNPSLAQMLQQLRGQKVEVTLIGGTKPMTGIVVGTEKRRSIVGPNRDQIVETELLNLRTEDGLRSVPLDTVLLTKFLDEKTDRDFQRALTLLATAHQSDQKSIKLDFRGNGQRLVSIGYVQESPVWKTSYRLVLDDEKPPFLQGWAIVENTTAQDWNDVNLTLVSGRSSPRNSMSLSARDFTNKTSRRRTWNSAPLGKECGASPVLLNKVAAALEVVDSEARWMDSEAELVTRWGGRVPVFVELAVEIPQPLTITIASR